MHRSPLTCEKGMKKCARSGKFHKEVMTYIQTLINGDLKIGFSHIY